MKEEVVFEKKNQLRMMNIKPRWFCSHVPVRSACLGMMKSQLIGPPLVLETAFTCYSGEGKTPASQDLEQ
jgi:hypothetical protein